MKYFGGCDVGSTYAKCVILNEEGKIVSDATIRSKINPVKKVPSLHLKRLSTRLMISNQLRS